MAQSDLALFHHQTHDHYEELAVGDDVYVKKWLKGRWTVIHYTRQSFAGFKAWQEARRTEARQKSKRPPKEIKRKPVSQKQHKLNQAKARILLNEILGQPTGEQINLDI